MNLLTRSRRALVVGIVAAAATLSMTQVANAGPAAPEVPPELAVESGNTMFLVGHAKGVQIYKCTGATTNGTTTFSWKFVEPRAELLGDNGERIAHGAGPTGPTWQAPDGSMVVGSVPRRNPATLPADAKDIQLLLLKGTPSPAGPDGGLLGKTTFIQRLATKHGTAPPAASCKAATADKIHEVPYKADYFFWKSTTGA